MDQPATDIARRLAARAEAVCRHYLSSGRREGRYWMVGDMRNTPGRSLYVRLVDMEKGPAGKWTDAATGEHGDLLDIIAATQGTRGFAETLEEARRFLALPPEDNPPHPVRERPRAGRLDAHRSIARMLGGTRSLANSIAADYLRGRGITCFSGCDALRFHPRLSYRPGPDDVPHTHRHWPALVAKVTDSDGQLTGIHRTWIDPATRMKAPLASPRRSLGAIAGHAVRFGRTRDVMIAGEGIETILSLRDLMPDMPMAAATSSSHLAAFFPPSGLKRLYVALDRDEAGEQAARKLRDRAHKDGIGTNILTPMLGDFNEDLVQLGKDQLARTIADQLCIADQDRFLPSSCS
ncbi:MULTISPECIES: DUF7146 domain-containing protein [Sphingomonadales]|uniref:DUF7146 domain-containing protein n=1 Tax=Sphingomonadales TaxID=204457 RepID=UPI00086E0507|nr:toprim domain-containing protein [Novosphingobium sp. SCN 63-17]ODU76581.1 MAG: DNA primase [Novosphingobium sp. SCN 63-17]